MKYSMASEKMDMDKFTQSYENEVVNGLMTSFLDDAYTRLPRLVVHRALR